MNLYPSEKINNYKVKYRKKEYWESLVQDDEVLWSGKLEQQYLEKALLKQMQRQEQKKIGKRQLMISSGFMKRLENVAIV